MLAIGARGFAHNDMNIYVDLDENEGKRPLSGAMPSASRFSIARDAIRYRANAAKHPMPNRCVSVVRVIIHKTNNSHRSGREAVNAYLGCAVATET